MDMGGRLDSLLGQPRGLGQRLMVDKRERGDTREREDLIVRKTNEAEGMVREARGRDINARYEDIRGLIK